ncbi:MAG TPA: PIN domain-containing protein [Terriglobales bacterium]|nr:PIN domain-containing protein [Terriglobales bacterium]
MSRIFWDTNLFIYLFEDDEENKELTQMVEDLRRKMLKRGDELLTSTMTLGEILVKPMNRGDSAVCRLYEETISANALLVPFDQKVARRYAAIRCTTTIKGPDAIQLACASEAKVDLFVTNDNRLYGKQIEGVQFIVALDRVPI